MKYLLIFILATVCSITYAQHEVSRTKEFIINGAVKNELLVSIGDLEKYSQSDLGDISLKSRKGEVKDTMRHVKGVLVRSILDKVKIVVDKPKEYGEYYFVFTASDDYKNIYSWSEIFNTDVGSRLYIITEKNGKSLDQMEDRILVYSMADVNPGLRHLKGLARIEVK